MSRILQQNNIINSRECVSGLRVSNTNEMFPFISDEGVLPESVGAFSKITIFTYYINKILCVISRSIPAQDHAILLTVQLL